MSGLQDCSKYDMMISERVDGTLNKKDARALDRHLAECAECRKYLQLLETVKEGLREELPDPPDALREGIMYKIGLEKGRKKHFGAFGRWTAIAAVLCVVIFGAVKLNGSGVMKSAAPEAASPASASGAGGTVYRDSAEDGAEPEPAAPEKYEVLTAAAPSPTLSAQFAGGSGGETPRDPEAPAAPAENGAWAEGEFDSVYRAYSLPGYDRARAALDSGDYWGVCLFYDRLPEEVSAASWQEAASGEGELQRWELTVGELQALEKDAEWNEFYYGDLTADRGLVIMIAHEEE